MGGGLVFLIKKKNIHFLRYYFCHYISEGIGLIYFKYSSIFTTLTVKNKLIYHTIPKIVRY